MSKINCEITKHSGFCPGVRSAVNAAFDESKRSKLLMLGEVVHNRVVVDELVKNHNCDIINEKDLDNLNEKSVVLIRAHGVKKSIFDKLKSLNVKILDKTCPKVSKIQKIVRENFQNGKKIIVIGNPKHPEIIGVVGWCENSAIIIQNFDEFRIFLENFNANESYVLVFQTTFDYFESKRICEICSKYRNIDVYNTVCNDTFLRQSEIENLSRNAEMVLIVGGKNSSNCNKLLKIAKNHCEKSYLVIEKGDLKSIDFQGVRRVLLCGGASTPLESINEIARELGD